MSAALDRTKKKRHKPIPVKPLFGWCGVVNGDQIDLDPLEDYGRLYRTKREARALYNRVVRVIVRQPR